MFPKPIINAAGPLTRLGGGPLHASIVQAMAEASQHTWNLVDLHRWAGQQVARAFGAEAALITSSATAAMVLSTAAIMAGTDRGRMANLGSGRDDARIVIQRGHRNAYDRAWCIPGANFLEIGYAGRPGTGDTQLWQWEEALAQTGVVAAALVWGMEHDLPIERVVNLAHAQSIPVMADAAAILPDLKSLERLLALGVDAVAVSGGKALGGPQNSGLLLGSSAVIESALAQSLDHDWDAAMVQQYFPQWRDGPPTHGIGRGFKVGKETILGLEAAVRRFTTDFEQIWEEWRNRVGKIRDALKSRMTLEMQVTEDPESGPALLVLCGERTAAQFIADRLQQGDPRVEVNRHGLRQSQIRISPLALKDDQIGPLAEALGRAVDAVNRGD